MRRQKVLVAGSGACVLVLTMVAAAVAHMAGGDSAGTGDAGTVALQNSRAGSARVLGLPIRDAQLGDPLNGWTGEQGSGVGFLPLRPDAPPLPDFLGTSTASPGHLDELRTLGNDFSWLNEYGRSFRLANVGTSFTFRPGNGGGLGGGGASRSPVGVLVAAVGLREAVVTMVVTGWTRIWSTSHPPAADGASAG